MGIGLTQQQVEGWEGQLARMERFLERANSARANLSGLDEDDFIIAVFQNSIILRDWICVSRPECQVNVEALFAQNLEFRLCRDIANGYKHMKISRPSIDATFSIVFEYNPFLPRGGDYVVLAGGYKFNFFALAEKCVAMWKEFVVAYSILPSSVAKK